MTSEPDDRLAAVALVHRPGGTAPVDRAWARSLVVRHAAHHRLRLVAVYELADDKADNGDVLTRLRDLASRMHLDVLITDGIRIPVRAALAREPVLPLEDTASQDAG